MAAITIPTNHRSIRRKKGRWETLLTIYYFSIDIIGFKHR
jgi:hypothetical protein